MTTNFRQYLGTGAPNAQGRYDLMLRTHKGQRYADARVIASFNTHTDMTQAWLRCTDLEGMVDVYTRD